MTVAEDSVPKAEPSHPAGPDAARQVRWERRHLVAADN